MTTSSTSTRLEDFIFDAHQLASLQEIAEEFTACPDQASRNQLAIRACERLLEDKAGLDWRAYGLSWLIDRHCGATTLLDSTKGEDLRRLSKKAYEKRVKPYNNIRTRWGEDVAVAYFGDAPYEFLRYGNCASDSVRDWQEASRKLSQIIVVKKQRGGILQTVHFKHLAKWKDKGSYWLEGIELSYSALRHGYAYDKHGLVDLASSPVCSGEGPQRGITPRQDTLHSTRPRDSTKCNGMQAVVTSDTSPNHSDQPNAAVATLNAYMEEVEDESEEDDQPDSTDRTAIRASCKPVSEHEGQVSNATERRTNGQLHRRTQNTSSSLGKRGREDEVHESSEQHGSKRRAPARPNNIRKCKQMAALCGIGRALKKHNGKVGYGSRKRDEAKHQADKAMLRAEEAPFRHTRVYKQLLIDDCATDVLLTGICPARSYTPDFEPTPLQISFRSHEEHLNDLATISECVIGVRENHRLDSPRVDHLCKQLALYSKMLSPSCPFDLVTTIQYSEQEQWCIKTRGYISMGPLPYLQGACVEVADANGALEESLQFGCMFGPCGTLYAIVGPPRFLSHSCEPNARVEIRDDRAVVIALCDIKKGEEITIDYGENYFGEENEACSCKVCCPHAESSSYLPRFWPQRKLFSCAQPADKGRRQEEDSFRDAINKQADHHLRYTDEKTQLFDAYHSLKPSLEKMRSPDDGEALVLTAREAADLFESGEAINVPVFVRTPNLVQWQRTGNPIDELFEEYSNDQLRWKIAVQSPLMSTRAEGSAREMTLGTFWEKLDAEKTEFLNGLELANPMQHAVPSFLMGVNCSVYHHAIMRFRCDGQGGRPSKDIKDASQLILIAQRGAISKTHQDSGGKDTYITCQYGKIGFCWYSRSAHSPCSGDRPPSSARFRVLQVGDTVWFPAGTEHYVVRLETDSNTLAFSGHIMRWSGLSRSLESLNRQLEDDQVSNEWLDESDVRIYHELQTMVMEERSALRISLMGGNTGRTKILELIRVRIRIVMRGLSLTALEILQRIEICCSINVKQTLDSS